MDTFFEQIVRKKKSAAQWLLIVGVLVLALILLVLVLQLRSVTLLVPLLVCGIGFGAWWLITEQNREVEYSVTNGDIDIDEIIARRRRRRIVSVTGRKIEMLLPYEPGKVNEHGFQRVVTAAPSRRETGLWYFTYHSKKNGHTLVIFQPQPRVLKALYAGLPKLVQMDTDRALREKGITLE